jgi:hypothetical protein
MPPYQFDLRRYPGEKFALILAPVMENDHLRNICHAANAFLKLDYRHIGFVTTETHAFHSEGMRTTDGKTSLTPHSSTLEGITSALDAIRRRFNASRDLFTLYVTGHGKQYGTGEGIPQNGPNEGDRIRGSASLDLQGYQLTGEYLSLLVDAKLEKPRALIICDQCYGYDFAKPFVGHDRLIISASKEGKISRGISFPSVFFPRLKESGCPEEAFAVAYRLDENCEKGIQQPQMVRVGLTSPPSS